MGRLMPMALLFALAGCVLGGAETSRVEKVPDEFRRPHLVAPRISDRHPFGDVTKVHPGDWATYRQGERTFTLADVGESGGDVWIELIEETEPRQISARLVGRDGVVKKAYYGEISKDGWKSTVEAQPLEQTAPPGERTASELSRESSEETVTVGGRELRARRITVRMEDLEGRLSQEVSLWSSSVPPLYEGSREGGLVRRQTSASTVELIGFGTDARPQLAIPR